jgi:DNA polymerase-3 subunit delta
LLIGEEDFLIEEIVSKIKSKLNFSDKNDLNFEKLRGNETSIPMIIEKAETLPFLGESRLIIVTNIDELSQFYESDQLYEYLSSPCETTALVFVGKKSDKKKEKKKVYSLIKEKFIVVEFEPLKKNQLIAWVAKEIKTRKIAMSTEAQKLLVELSGANLRQLNAEIEKISLYSNNKKISEEDIYNLVLEKINQSIFEMTDAIGSKSVEKALITLNRLLDSGEAPLKILSLMAWQIRLILIVKTLQNENTPLTTIPARAGFPPFLMSKYNKMASLFSTSSLKQGIYLLMSADSRLKSDLPPKLILESLVIDLSLN